MISRSATALFAALAFSGAAQAAPIVTNSQSCDAEFANVTAMRAGAAVGPKTKAAIDGLLVEGDALCRAQSYGQADSLFARLRGMMANE